MTQNQRLLAVRDVLSELNQAQLKAALCVAHLKELTAIDDPANLGGIRLPRIDEGTYCVCWQRRRCQLGHTTSYRLLARLVRRLGHYVSYDHLLRDVWDDRVVSRHTIRSAVRQLKSKLVEANMTRLARSIRGRDQHYGLILNRDDH